LEGKKIASPDRRTPSISLHLLVEILEPIMKCKVEGLLLWVTEDTEGRFLFVLWKHNWIITLTFAAFV
jgi:hypothetical protein